jgi:hypothetical protein
LGIEKAPTTFGTLTALLTPRTGGADFVFHSDFHNRPRSLVVRIPYFVRLASFKTDARESKRDGDVIRLSSDATNLNLEWTLNPEADRGLFQELLLAYRREPGFWEGKRSDMPEPPKGFLTETEQARPTEPLSFKLVLEAWKTEYARRFTAHVKAGGSVKPFAPVPLQPEAERTAAVAKYLEGYCQNAGGPVTCSPGSANPAPV